MRQQTSSGRCWAVSHSIHKRKTCSFWPGKALSNDILVLKIDRKMTPQCLWRCRAASVSDQWRNRCVGKLRADAVRPFNSQKKNILVYNRKRYFQRQGRFENRLKKRRCSALPKLPAETDIDQPVHKVLTTTCSVLGFSALVRQPRK